ncbi:uncharacterized protein LOC128266570 [Drosophila gunungcola]|uniref:Uncharacterized protein n=1 Tax=Drosophila gunungcola TaxID=103775 RepID=A0A9P9Z1F7_9MUSC|nr:uncharacterized protein LOC128266570 [Drosophila gunungcola]KAI8046723.1 hypothetical protein M5D96_002936 [Drosophila gunungcola]
MQKLQEQRKSQEENGIPSTPKTKKSSMTTKKKSSHEFSAFKSLSKLKFRNIDTLPISARDYGLMRSNNKSSTPYPRAEQGVDASLLKARLTMRRVFETRQSKYSKDSGKKVSPTVSNPDSHHSQSSAVGHARASVTVFRRQSLTNDNLKEMLSIGTPHPSKGVALSARLLTRRLTDINDLLKLREEAVSQKAATPLRSRKKKVSMPMDPDNRDSIIPVESRPDGELVSKSISSRLTQLDYDASVTSQSEESLMPLLSFAERRRIFHEGEFTIARYGRKMSDVMMASTPQQHQVIDNSLQFAKKANDEIEKYMISQGLIKTSHDQITMTRQFSRPSDSREMQGENYTQQNSKHEKSVSTRPHKEFL